MTTSPTSESVANWMLEKIKSDGVLDQEVAVDHIFKKFGGGFTYENDSGNLAISKKVLSAFRKLTEEIVVWERGERRWRMRDKSDAPGRQQT